MIFRQTPQTVAFWSMYRSDFQAPTRALSNHELVAFVRGHDRANTLSQAEQSGNAPSPRSYGRAKSRAVYSALIADCGLVGQIWRRRQDLNGMEALQPDRGCECPSNFFTCPQDFASPCWVPLGEVWSRVTVAGTPLGTPHDYAATLSARLPK